MTCAYVLEALPASEADAAEAHIAFCPDCQREVENLHSVVKRFVAWPADIVRPPASLQDRLALRIAGETGKHPEPPPARQWSEPAWEEVAPGIECKLLATDTDRHRVSMLVHLAPGASYPAHTHAGIEELHLLDGELWIDERKLSRATTTTVLPERATRASGARPAAPVCLSPAPRTSCAEALRAQDAQIENINRPRGFFSPAATRTNPKAPV